MAQVSEEQLNSARDIHRKQQQIQLEIGSLYVSEQDIKARKEKLISDLRATGDEIQALMTPIEEEFGFAGSLNLETGEFMPSSKEA